ncbi:MAG: glycosyltransferase family 4 protein [Planctomycetota bacterium]
MSTAATSAEQDRAEADVPRTEAPPWPPRAAERPIKVAMLLTNPCINDGRVIKEAESLALAGHEVRVYCTLQPGLPETESRAGVTYLRHTFRLRPIKYLVVRLLGVPEHAEDAGPPENPPRPLLVRLLRVAVILLLSPLVLILALITGHRGGLINGRAMYQVARVINGGWLHVLRRLKPSVRFIRKVLALGPSKVIRTLIRWSPFHEVAGPMRAYWAARTAIAPSAAAWRPDIVHAHDLVTLPAAVEVQRFCGARIVYDAHEFATLEIENEDKLARRFKERTEQREIQKTDGMITVSRGFAREFSERYGIPKPTVVFNSPPYEPRNLIERDVRSDLGFSDDVPLAVYIGGLNPRRALTQLAEAMVHAPEFQLVKVGGRVPHWEEMFLEEVEKHGVRDRVHILDGVPPSQVIHYVRTGDIGIITRIKFSLQQDFSMPNKLFESLLGRLPIAVGKVAEIADFLDEHPHGVLMNSLDPEDIARAMRETYERREELRPTDADVESIMNEYGLPAQAAKLIDLYDRVGRRAGGATS